MTSKREIEIANELASVCPISGGHREGMQIDISQALEDYGNIRENEGRKAMQGELLKHVFDCGWGDPQAVKAVENYREADIKPRWPCKTHSNCSGLHGG